MMVPCVNYYMIYVHFYINERTVLVFKDFLEFIFSFLGFEFPF